MIFVPSSKKSAKSNFLYLNTAGQMQDWLTVDTVKSPSDCSTLNFTESPSVVKESFLSLILEQDVPLKYYLSARACEGILRRAQAHNKPLPHELEKILIAQSSA